MPSGFNELRDVANAQEAIIEYAQETVIEYMWFDLVYFLEFTYSPDLWRRTKRPITEFK